MITFREVVHGERSSNRVTRSMIRPTLAIYCGTMSCYLICTPLALRRVVRRQFEGENSYDVFLAYK